MQEQSEKTEEKLKNPKHRSGNKEKWGGFKEYLRVEIAIEYKACLYFFCMLFFYCCYQVVCHVYTASILHMAEMILAAYLMGYIQVYLMGNFDEADFYGIKGLLKSIFCTALYTALSYALGWFDKNILVTAVFALFLTFAYFCAFLINKIKRDLDTKLLNNMLTDFKKGEELQ